MDRHFAPHWPKHDKCMNLFQSTSGLVRSYYLSPYHQRRAVSASKVTDSDDWKIVVSTAHKISSGKPPDPLYPPLTITGS